MVALLLEQRWIEPDAGERHPLLDQGRSELTQLRAEVDGLRRDNLELRHQAGYWRGLHARVLERLTAVEQEHENLRGEIARLYAQLFGQKSEKQARQDRSNHLDGLDDEADRAGDPKSKPTQQKRKGPKRRDFSHLPSHTELVELPEAEQVCPRCGQPWRERIATDDSEQSESEIKAYRRVLTFQATLFAGELASRPCAGTVPWVATGQASTASHLQTSIAGPCYNREMIARFQNALILTGPTGAGKSDLGVALAERLGAEIISMDSMALYRGLNIGTAKPGPELRKRVPHHLLDVVEPWESASVAWWLDRAAACCQEIEARGKRVLIVGGTPLYLKALLFGLFDGPPADAALRRRLEAEADCLGRPALHARLAQVDPVSATRLHVNDLRRVVRALEVWELTGKPLSTWQTQWSAPDSTSRAESNAAKRVLCLDLPRTELYARINARVRWMFDAGLVEEARALRQLPRPLSREAGQALGYKEVFAYLAGKATLDETIAQVQTHTRQFAKRQLTWFRRLPASRLLPQDVTAV